MHDVRCNVVMLQEIAEDVTEQPVSAAGIEWLVELSACIIQTDLMYLSVTLAGGERRPGFMDSPECCGLSR